MIFNVVVDSCCDLPPQLLDMGCFRSVPLTISVGGDEYIDDASLNPEHLITAMAACKEPAHTSCPSPGLYLETFEGCQGDIYVVTLSALLSGSHNSAWQAAQMFHAAHPERNIHVFNSCSASAGEVQVARKIAELAGSGCPFYRVVDLTDQYIGEMNTLFVLDNLDNLRKNGRLSRIQALITGALPIKLLLGSTPEGEICKRGQAMSMKQALTKMANMMAADPRHRGTTLCIAHCACSQRAEFLRTLVFKYCQFRDVYLTETRGISTVYANEGGIVAAY